MNKENRFYNNFNSSTFQNGITLFENIHNQGVTIFGASGEMGSKITSTFLRASIPTLMQDINLEKLEVSRQNTLETLEKAVKKRKLSKEQYNLITKNNLIKDLIVFPENGKIPFEQINGNKAKASTFLDGAIKAETKRQYQNSFMILEAGPENLAFKQNVFQFFETILNSEDAVLATNTSSLKVSDIAAKLKNPERVVGFHYFLPAHVNSLIEIIVGDKTSVDVVQTMHNLAISMGKKPIICWKDDAGAIANRILVGILNEAARLYDEGFGTVELIDRAFLETFYSEQIKVQTSKAKRQFQVAPKLSFFKDESHIYKKIKQCEKDKSYTKKKLLLEELEGKLRQKILYSQIVENLAVLGDFFIPAPCVKKLQEKAQKQIKEVRDYLNEIEKDPSRLKKEFRVKSYTFPPPERSLKNNSIEQIKERFQGAYIAISQEIYDNGLGSIQDIELACKEGFKWNIGPFELINRLGAERANILINLTLNKFNPELKCGVAFKTTSFNKNEVSGIQTFIQDNIGYIVLGRLHIQQLQMSQNSLSPALLNTINNAIEDFESNKDIESIFIKSQGGGPFSAGADLNYIESTDWNPDIITDFINLGKQVMDKIANCKKPTVAIVDGPAVGGGGELALACDYRIMTDSSYVSFPEVALGIIPDWGGTERLPALIGKELSKRLICTATLKNLGLKLGAEDSLSVGFTDVYVLQSELPFYIKDISVKQLNINFNYYREPKLINVFVKPERKLNYEKSDYPENVVQKFKLNKPFKVKFNMLNSFGGNLALKLIEHSHDLNYIKEANTDTVSKNLLKHGKWVYQLNIKPFVQAVQNKFLAYTLEKLRLV